MSNTPIIENNILSLLKDLGYKTGGCYKFKSKSTIDGKYHIGVLDGSSDIIILVWDFMQNKLSYHFVFTTHKNIKPCGIMDDVALDDTGKYMTIYGNCNGTLKTHYRLVYNITGEPYTWKCKNYTCGNYTIRSYHSIIYNDKTKKEVYIKIEQNNRTITIIDSGNGHTNTLDIPETDLGNNVKIIGIVNKDIYYIAKNELNQSALYILSQIMDAQQISETGILYTKKMVLSTSINKFHNRIIPFKINPYIIHENHKLIIESTKQQINVYDLRTTERLCYLNYNINDSKVYSDISGDGERLYILNYKKSDKWSTNIEVYILNRTNGRMMLTNTSEDVDCIITECRDAHNNSHIFTMGNDNKFRIYNRFDITLKNICRGHLEW